MVKRLLAIAAILLLLPALVVTASAEELVCTCSDWCATGAVNASCPVCSVEGADLSGCTGALPVVTIEYADGTRAAWNGQTRLDITKNALVTVNAPFSMNSGVYVDGGATVEIEGKGHAITASYGEMTFFKSGPNASVIINNLNLTCTDGLYNDIVVYGYAEMNNCNIAHYGQGHLFRVEESTGTLVINSGYYYSAAVNNPMIYSYGAVTINGGEFKTDVTGIINNRNKVTINDGILTTSGATVAAIYSTGSSSLYINGGSIFGEYVAINNGNIYISDGEISSNNLGVNNGRVYISGGSVTGNNGQYGVWAIYMEITGGTIQGWQVGTGMGTKGEVLKIGGDLTFADNDADILLSEGKTFTVYDSFADSATVKIVDDLPANTIRPITTADTSQEKLAQFTSVDGYSVGYWDDYIFLYRHVHNWEYTGEGNTVTAKCTITSVPSCQYHEEGLELVLTAEDMGYTGAAYDKATFTNAITEVTGEEPGTITYLNAEGQTINAPVERGSYTAQIEIGGAVAQDPFAILRTYTVNYVADGTTVDTQTVMHGADAAAPEIPGKTGCDQTAPTWNHDGKNITSDLTITAVYTPNTYTVTYVADGETVDTQTVTHGEDASAPQIPAKTGYDQTAPSWDHDGKNITGDLIINAVYTPNTYTVKYVADGETVDTQTVKHGEDASAPQIPAKTGYDQTAPAWDHDGKNITSDLTINAVYTPNVYIVTYMVDGQVVATVEVVYGEDVEAPDVPGKEGNTGAWHLDAKNVTSDLTVLAVYTPIPVTPATGDAFPVGRLVCIVAVSFAGVLAMYPAKRRV